MHTFKDNADRDWQLAINVTAIKRVKDLLDVDLLEVTGVELLGRLAADPVLLCDVIYCVCKPQADAQGVSDEDFGRAMGGDAIDTATTALLEELVDFFPSRRRELLRTALGKLRGLESKALAAAQARLDNPKLEQRMEKDLQKAFEDLDAEIDGRTSTPSPGSSESTQGR